MNTICRAFTEPTMTLRQFIDCASDHVGTTQTYDRLDQDIRRLRSLIAGASAAEGRVLELWTVNRDIEGEVAPTRSSVATSPRRLRARLPRCVAPLGHPSSGRSRTARLAGTLRRRR